MIQRELVTLFVAGTPRPAGGLRIIPARGGGRPHLAPASSKTLNRWKKELKTTLLAEYDGQPVSGPIAVDLGFWLGRPLSHSTTKGLRPEAPEYPLSKTGDYGGDFDKLTRAVCDCLTGVVIVDDSQIVDAQIRKRYITVDHRSPGVDIYVSRITDDLDTLFAETGQTP